MTKALDIAVLYNTGCPATPKTVALIQECISELGILADLRQILVATVEEANRLRFLGSPTVQVNGNDIDPAVRDSKSYGFM